MIGSKRVSKRISIRIWIVNGNIYSHPLGSNAMSNENDMEKLGGTPPTQIELTDDSTAGCT